MADKFKASTEMLYPPAATNSIEEEESEMSVDDEALVGEDAEASETEQPETSVVGDSEDIPTFKMAVDHVQESLEEEQEEQDSMTGVEELVARPVRAPPSHITISDSSDLG